VWLAESQYEPVVSPLPSTRQTFSFTVSPGRTLPSMNGSQTTSAPATPLPLYFDPRL